MNYKHFLFLSVSIMVLVFMGCFGDNRRPPPAFRTQQLMTGQDVINASYSNISIKNATTSSVTASGIFIAGYDTNDCSVCTGTIVGGNNAIGALVEPVTFEAGQSIQIGQNYLYNLIYNGLYGVQQVIGSPCQLPGCSWPGDSTGITGWCLSINLMSRTTSYTSSSYTNGTDAAANVVPFSQAVSSAPFHYNYDLIDPNTLTVGTACLGPVVCNDQTLTCTVSSAQTLPFQSY